MAVCSAEHTTISCIKMDCECGSSQKEFDTVNGELRSLFAVLGRADIASTLDWIAGQRLVVEEQRAELQSKIEEAERHAYTAGAHDALTLKAQNQLYSEVQTLQTQLGAARNARDSLAFGIADSGAFIASLRNKLVELNDAEAVRTRLGKYNFGRVRLVTLRLIHPPILTRVICARRRSTWNVPSKLELSPLSTIPRYN